MVGQIYQTELQLIKANSSDTEALFLDLNLSITNDIVSSKIYDKRDDFNFEIVNFPFLDGVVPRSPSYSVYISQLIRFARVCSNVDDFNNRNLFLTAKLLKQGYRYHKIRKADYESMKKELKAFQTDFDRESGIKDVEYLWTLFKNKIHALMEKYIPSKLLLGNKLQKPWISREVKGLVRKRNKLFKRQRKTGNPKDIKHYKETKARLQKAERQSYWNFVDNIIEVGDPEQEHQPKQKRFWSFIKSLRKDTSGVAPLKDNGRLHADPKPTSLIGNTNLRGLKRIQATYQRQTVYHILQCQRSRLTKKA